MPLIRRNTEAIEKALVDPEIQEIANSERQELEKHINMKKVISTGSTLLDLTISGGVTEEGGVPGGIFLEVFGPSGAGKTTELAELAASCQSHGGSVRFCDPEARLDKEYTQIYGVSMEKDFEYHRPDTVSSMFTDYIWPWTPKTPDKINMIAADSVASLSTDIEMDNDDGDKMGMRRAKEFSEGLRKTCRLVANRQWLVAMTNQLRQKQGGGKTTPGGEALKYYASLRIEIVPVWQKSEIKKVVTLESGVKVEQIVGIYSHCYIEKSSLDIPYRECNLSIVFGYGIDDVRDQLQWYKDMTKETTYNCFDKTYQSMDAAIRYIEQNNYQDRLKKRTIGLWREIQEKFKIDRQRKVR